LLYFTNAGRTKLKKKINLKRENYAQDDGYVTNKRRRGEGSTNTCLVMVEERKGEEKF